MTIDSTIVTIRLAQQTFVTPCRLNVYDDEGKVLVELFDVHGRPTDVTGKGRTYGEAVEAIRAELVRRGPAVPMVCPDADSLAAQLQKSVDRARQQLPPHTFGDFPRAEKR